MGLIFANTDLPEIFPLGLGTFSAGSKWVGTETDRIIETFLDEGGNLLDTARVYSILSKSEPAIGEWLQRSGKRHEVILVSKGGHPDMLAKPINLHNFRLSKEEMVSDLEESLQALKTDYIDIYLYHRDDPARSVEEVVETMQDFVRQGNIRYYGVSNWTLPRMIEAQNYAKEKGYRGFVMNQELVNIASDHMLPPRDDTMVIVDEKIKEYHRAIQGTDHDILCTGYFGNCGGFFHQYINGGAESVRSKIYLTPENIEIAEKIRANTREKGTTILQEVLSFYRNADFPCLGLFGPRDAAGIKEAMKAFK